MQDVHQHTFENGLTLVAQSMPWLASAAFSLYVPAGCRFDPADKIGTANFVCEMVQRGCGKSDSRQFIESLDMLGVDYHSSAGVYHTHFGGAMPAAQLLDALSIYADVLRRPHFPDDQLEDGRMVCFQEIRAIEDDISQRTYIALRKHHYGDPDGRISQGTTESVQAITMDDLKRFFQERYQPDGLILAVAGKIDWEQLKQHVEDQFGDWAKVQTAAPAVVPAQHGVHHIPFESEQTQIALAYPSVSYSDDDYYTNRCAIGVLSDGVSSRLFSEVREKRGLSYSVYASCQSIKDQGAVVCCAGTSAIRAQETLDVVLDQLRLLAKGVTQKELDRLKVRFRSSLVMQSESCRAKTGTLAGDWFHLGRTRSLDEITKEITGMTVDRINEYLANNPARDFDLVTLGPAPLELKDGISATSAK